MRSAETSSPKWIINVQFITWDESPALLELLRFPAYPLLPREVLIQLYGPSFRRRRFKLAELDDFISLVLHQQANEFQLDFRFERYQIPGSEIVVTALTNILTVSPTSCVWKPAGPEPEGRTAWRHWKTTVGMEQNVRWKGLKSYPTLLQSVIEIESPLSGSELARRLYEILGASIPPTLVPLNISGAADLEKQLGPADFLQALAPWPGAMRFLTDRFDGLHTIMFGPVDRCKELARLLGEEVAVRNIGSELDMVYVPDEIVNAESSSAAVKNLLVPKDDSTAFKVEPKEALGEYALGTGMIFTYRRQQELVREGFLSPPSADHECFHLIRPKYCEMLGWNPDDMVVMNWHKEGIRRVEAEIDIAFEELTHIDSIKRRVFAAHKEVNMKHGWARYVMDFVERQYFDDLEQ